MNLRTLLTVNSGGPGSGCRGPSCGRKPGFGQPPIPENTRQSRAQQSFKPSTQDKQLIADKSEQQLSTELSLPRTKNNSAFDLQSKHVGVEIKTLVDQTNSKITVHPESLLRKLDEAQKSNLRIYTVAVDMRDPNNPQYLYRKGVGSFHLSTMTAVRSIDDLRKVIK